jgi:hypothetical protein
MRTSYSAGYRGLPRPHQAAEDEGAERRGRPPVGVPERTVRRVGSQANGSVAFPRAGPAPATSC